MVVEATDKEEWDVGNTEGFARGEEYFGNAENEAKFGDEYELDEADPAEGGDWDTEWYDQAGEAMQDVDGEELAYENEGEDCQEDEDDPDDDWTDSAFPPEDASVGGREYG